MADRRGRQPKEGKGRPPKGPGLVTVEDIQDDTLTQV